MNPRAALLRAADHIEANPKSYRFARVTIPRSSSDTACAIGWVGFFSGKRRGHLCADSVLGCDEMDFYDRMGDFGRAWMAQASVCAKNLRKYADKYHPETERESFFRRILRRMAA